MLRFLRVQNLAVIESADVEFDAGFNVLTGETGAGKSILVEAIGLLLGSRASADLVRSGASHATIEALFDDASGGEVVVRREISQQGRSRAFVDGVLASAAALRDLSETLVELHGQHEHHVLLDPADHLPLLDEYVRVGPLLAEVHAASEALREARERLERVRMDGRERGARLDLIEFQLAEIGRLSPRAGEDEELGVTRQVLASAERVKTLCDECYAMLYDGEHAVLAELGRAWKRVGELSGVDPRFGEYLASRDEIKSRLEDLSLFVRRYGDDIDASPERLQQVEERLAHLDRVKRKYGPSLTDVIDRAVALTRERHLLTDSAQSVDVLEADVARLTIDYLDVARRLSAARRTAAVPFSRELERRLGELGMSRTRFEARFSDGPPGRTGGERGIDEAEFYVSTNLGEAMRPLARTVSGGELSRLMLALKTMRAARGGPRTLVFDEVDAGIGGRVADVVGARLREVAAECQVLCITHLPQIAARASTQFRIEKAVKDGRTITTVERLDEDGRVDEIARMMGGEFASDAVRQGARELLRGAMAKGKQTAKGESERPRRG